ncbi:hypothetical protein [Puia dinghuensis]|uniref:hypothetical protein n=1 Tax=Puia dinghuensis TaxID=1792502 RepID=UPI0016696A2C|nr:hypothetical protein [Puia dinghuensis]
MRKIVILFLCIIPFLGHAQNDVLVLTRRGFHVRSYTVGDHITFETVYGQWFDGNIDDLHRDTVYMNGQAFSYKEIGAIKRERTKWNNKVNGVLLTTAGVGLFAIGAINGGIRGDAAKQWYTTSGYIVGGALIAGGVALIVTSKKYYPLGGRYKLQYLQIGRH